MSVADAEADASGGGILAGMGTNVNAVAAPCLSAYIGNYASLNVSGNVSVTTLSVADADARAKGISVGSGPWA